MSAFANLRMLAYLRRIAVAQERIATAAETFLAHERQSWKERPARATEFSTLDVAEANDRWRKEQEAAEVGATLEDCT